MAGEADLSALSVLVVDNQFLLADDVRRALELAGAKVLGPCRDEEAALALLEVLAPDCAVLDPNLGAGPTFEIAGALKAKGVPFVFLTGYDDDVIPEEFSGAACLKKPADYRRLIAEVARASSPV
jgi:DNA-binding NarL/FixJ family response regulator